MKKLDFATWKKMAANTNKLFDNFRRADVLAMTILCHPDVTPDMAASVIAARREARDTMGDVVRSMRDVTPGAPLFWDVHGVLRRIEAYLYKGQLP